jgi:hypothetical protein
MNNIQEIETIENMLKIGNYSKMFRVNYNGLRLYIQPEPFVFYSGLTGALSAATFKGDPDFKRLKGWREGMIDSFGAKNADDFLNMTADFGTLLHTALVTIKEKGCIDWAEEKERAFNYFIGCYRAKFLEPNVKVIKQQAYEYQKHVASLLQFVYERVHKIYAIETPVKWNDLRIATPVDLFCLCRQTEKGEFKPTTINLKTSSAISKHHMEQISCEMLMWNETYGADQPAEFTAAMRTKDWTEGKTPTFEYKYLNREQSSEIALNAAKRLELCLNSEATYLYEPKNKTFTGVTNIGEMPVIETKTLEEEWKSVTEITLPDE